MQTILGVQIATIMAVLLVVCSLISGGLLVLGLRNRILFRIGIRNVPRRRSQTLLIVCGLTLSTTIITSALGVGDTVSHSFINQVVSDLGPIDETITSTALTGNREGGFSTALSGGPFFTMADAAHLIAPFRTDRRIAAISPILTTQALFLDLSTNQRQDHVTIRAFPARGSRLFTRLPLAEGSFVSIGELAPGEIYLNAVAAKGLRARPGHNLQVTLAHRQVYLRVRQIVKKGGLAGQLATAVLSLEQIQALLGRSGQINEIGIANQSGGPGLVSYSHEIASSLRATLVQTATARAIQTLLSRPELQIGLAHALIQVRMAKITTGEAKLRQLQAELNSLPGAPVSEQLKDLLDDPFVNFQLHNVASTLPSKSLGLRLKALLDEVVTFTVREAKADGIDQAQQAGTQFSTTLLVFSLFTISTGLLLIFLIFVLMAAERRGEMGISRAVGLRRAHLVEVFLFEGSTYDLFSSLLGVVTGVGVGLALIAIVTTSYGRFDIQIEPYFTIPSLVSAYCLGLLLTFITVGFSAWRVSRLNIVTAIRNLPEPAKLEIALWRLFLRPFQEVGLAVKWVITWHPVKALSTLYLAGSALFGFLTSCISRGIRRGPLLLLFGVLLLFSGIGSQRAALFGLGVSFALIGTGLLVRWLVQAATGWRRVLSFEASNRIGYSIAGLGLLVYWSLPFNLVTSLLGLPNFSFGPEIFFLAGIMMVAGAVWTTVYNADSLLALLSRYLGQLGRMAPVVKMAIAYPLQQKFRTGMALAMFALVIFTVIFISVITQVFISSFSELDALTGGFTLSGTTTVPIEHIRAAVTASPKLQVADFSVMSSIGQTYGSVRQLASSGVALPASQTEQEKGSYYPIAVASDDYLASTRYHLSIHALGYTTDRDVWEAVRTHPGYAIIDSSAVPSYNDSQIGGQGDYGFRLRGISSEDKTMVPVALEVHDPQTDKTTIWRIIGVLDGKAQFLTGLVVSTKTFGQAHFAPLQTYTYYFRLAPGINAQQEASALNAAFLAQGFTATVLADLIKKYIEVNTSLNAMLEGFVGLGLLVGIVALSVISSRAVVERRQQIGMLRAIGYSKRMVLSAFMLESSFVALLGTLLGISLGLLISYNFVTFLSSSQGGLSFVIPWPQILLIVGGAYLASLLTTWLPAYQASKIFPAEALRYE